MPRIPPPPACHSLPITGPPTGGHTVITEEPHWHVGLTRRPEFASGPPSVLGLLRVGRTCDDARRVVPGGVAPRSPSLRSCSFALRTECATSLSPLCRRGADRGQAQGGCGEPRPSFTGSVGLTRAPRSPPTACTVLRLLADAQSWAVGSVCFRTFSSVQEHRSLSFHPSPQPPAAKCLRGFAHSQCFL